MVWIRWCISIFFGVLVVIVLILCSNNGWCINSSLVWGIWFIIVGVVFIVMVIEFIMLLGLLYIRFIEFYDWVSCGG